MSKQSGRQNIRFIDDTKFLRRKDNNYGRNDWKNLRVCVSRQKGRNSHSIHFTPRSADSLFRGVGLRQMLIGKETSWIRGMLHRATVPEFTLKSILGEG